ncbi:16S rRNA (guanine(527)-N(7))-methyltransferase RsmG [Roseomonas sp. CECT 9278]|uniref:16S rRNA (guanine(527)-N(7))-methyltransferase RsmG n=1 Tax=Roseomonas sp. CECT 9278 TaxID=2845823 RepID=UPI001E4A3037|nr:16S rRNA (guanine(527)-N(7))-methyltransferase RsmG [Roseomonas sp. CECT 9278]CAH0144353.1 Ribosomal RNA small subunit methyltransferase G [Roseomonas sp. CECT 9278]
MKHPIATVPPDPARDARLATYRDLLLRWNATINLVSARTATEVDHRHIADSLQLLPLLPATGAIADLGSGAGLPGLVIAAALPDRDVHLVESDRRKAAFLMDAAGRMGLPGVKVHPHRIERATLPPIAAVTARALAPLDPLLGFAARFLAPGGIAVFPKGRTAEQELTSAATHWHFKTERFDSRTDPEATILRLSEIRRARDD